MSEFNTETREGKVKRRADPSCQTVWRRELWASFDPAHIWNLYSVMSNTRWVQLKNELAAYLIYNIPISM